MSSCFGIFMVAQLGLAFRRGCAAALHVLGAIPLGRGKKRENLNREDPITSNHPQIQHVPRQEKDRETTKKHLKSGDSTESGGRLIEGRRMNEGRV